MLKDYGDANRNEPLLNTSRPTKATTLVVSKVVYCIEERVVFCAKEDIVSRTKDGK